MTKKAILFDMDGVLVDSEPWVMRSAIEALAEFGIHAKPENFTKYIGAGEDKYVGGVAEDLGFSYDLRMKDRTYEIYGEVIRHQSIAYPGVRDVLQALKQQGYALAVCSSADLVKVTYNLEAIGVTPDFFGALITGNDVSRKKPFPDIYLAGADALGVSPFSCTVVEDALNGIRAAKAAGMRNIAVTTSFSAEELQRQVQPDFIIGTVADLLTVL